MQIKRYAVGEYLGMKLFVYRYKTEVRRDEIGLRIGDRRPLIRTCSVGTELHETVWLTGDCCSLTVKHSKPAEMRPPFWQARAGVPSVMCQNSPTLPRDATASLAAKTF